MSEETKIKISETKKRNYKENPKMYDHMKRPLPNKTKRKLSIINKGKHFSPKTEFKKGRRNQNRGLKLGKNPRHSEWMKKNRAGKNHPRYGKKHSVEERLKISNSLKKRYKDGDLISPLTILRKSGKLKVPYKDTSIEVKIQKFLKQLGIEFVAHQCIKDIKYGYQCDIFIPKQEGINQKTVIECDGDYWHGNLEIYSIDKMRQGTKEQRCLDYERTAQLEEAGFRVIRLWEHEIKEMDINKFNTQIIQ